jgi:Ca2+-binding EF-hand superfamily protein
MASKKKVATSGSHTAGPEFRILIELSQRARYEVQHLLKRAETGNITKVELNTVLKKVELQMKQMLDYINETLDEVSRLKRDQTRKIDIEELETRLLEVRTRLKLMVDHSNDW